jgi:hypothetical protein
MTDYQEDGRPT